MDNSRGLLISIEGVDGSGKTTQAKIISERLNDLGYTTEYTQEPTKGKIGILLRKYLSDPTSSPYVDALLFAADRIEHYEQEIKPLLEKGVNVITDRYIASSIVYQGSQGVAFDWVKLINNRVPMPDIHIFISIDIETALDRIENASRDVIEKFEKEEALQLIFDKYQQLIDKEWFDQIDGNGNMNEVSDRIIELIISKLKIINK